MADHHDDIRVPRFMLGAVGCLIGLTLLFAVLGKNYDVGTTHVPPADIVEARALKFFDSKDGGIAIHDAPSGDVVDVLPVKRSGFVRVVMRGLALYRKKRGIGAEEPFVLTRWADGRLSIRDDLTGRSIELRSFGLPNKKAFGRLLKSTGEQS